MPKVKDKRLAAKRAARVKQAHSAPYSGERRRNYNERRETSAPVQMFKKYPWGTSFITLVIIAGLGFLVYQTHAWQLLTPKAAPKATATVAFTIDGTSPCTSSSMISKLTDTSPAPSQSGITRSYSSAPTGSLDQSKAWCAGINTSKGLIVMQLDPKSGPLAANNFVFLAQHNFYDGLTFHRVEHPGQPSSIDGQPSSLDLIQGGDPKGDGSGGPGYSFNDDPVPSDQNYFSGIVAMANSGPNTNGSQFFICLADESSLLSKNYSIFGKVVDGLNVAQSIAVGDKMNHVIIATA